MTFDDADYEWDCMNFVPTDEEVVNDAIRNNDADLFYLIITNMDDETIAYYIDCWIETAIETNRPEFTAYLLDLKEKHNLYANPDWNL